METESKRMFKNTVERPLSFLVLSVSGRYAECGTEVAMFDRRRKETPSPKDSTNGSTTK
jgi:hypothetical protein